MWYLLGEVIEEEEEEEEREEEEEEEEVEDWTGVGGIVVIPVLSSWHEEEDE